MHIPTIQAIIPALVKAARAAGKGASFLNTANGTASVDPLGLTVVNSEEDAQSGTDLTRGSVDKLPATEEVVERSLCGLTTWVKAATLEHAKQERPPTKRATSRAGIVLRIPGPESYLCLVWYHSKAFQSKVDTLDARNCK